MQSLTDTKLTIYGEQFTSRMLIGSALYPSPEVMQAAIATSGAEIVTVSLRRQQTKQRVMTFGRLSKRWGYESYQTRLAVTA